MGRAAQARNRLLDRASAQSRYGKIPCSAPALSYVVVVLAAEGLSEHPAIMTHASIPAEIRAELGIGDSLVRLSAGVEDVEDLRQDLAQALARV